MAKGRMASMFKAGDTVQFHIDGILHTGVIRKIYPASGRTGHAKVKAPDAKTVTRKLDQIQKWAPKPMSNARYNAILFSGNARLKRDNGIC